MTVAESAPQADTLSVCVIRTTYANTYILTDTQRRAGLSAIAQACIQKCVVSTFLDNARPCSLGRHKRAASTCNRQPATALSGSAKRASMPQTSHCFLKVTVMRIERYRKARECVHDCTELIILNSRKVVVYIH